MKVRIIKEVPCFEDRFIIGNIYEATYLGLGFYVVNPKDGKFPSECKVHHDECKVYSDECRIF